MEKSNEDKFDLTGFKRTTIACVVRTSIIPHASFPAVFSLRPCDPVRFGSEPSIPPMNAVTIKVNQANSEEDIEQNGHKARCDSLHRSSLRRSRASSAIETCHSESNEIPTVTRVRKLRSLDNIIKWFQASTRNMFGEGTCLNSSIHSFRSLHLSKATDTPTTDPLCRRLLIRQSTSAEPIDDSPTSSRLLSKLRRSEPFTRWTISNHGTSSDMPEKVFRRGKRSSTSSPFKKTRSATLQNFHHLQAVVHITPLHVDLHKPANMRKSLSDFVIGYYCKLAMDYLTVPESPTSRRRELDVPKMWNELRKKSISELSLVIDVLRGSPSPSSSQYIHPERERACMSTGNIPNAPSGKKGRRRRKVQRTWKALSAANIARQFVIGLSINIVDLSMIHSSSFF
uniref:Uncharacterized protein n=1 Tax=Heterorhabditis bacteriophora TaxID=37862 RepID=A0A1I7W7I1_HETBA